MPPQFINYFNRKNFPQIVTEKSFLKKKKKNEEMVEIESDLFSFFFFELFIQVVKVSCFILKGQ